MNTIEKFDYIIPEAYLLAENNRDSGVKYEYNNGLAYAMTAESRFYYPDVQESHG